MRTKSLLLGAAALAASVATSMAANVYSVNVVGYVNLTVYPGFNMLANQLDVDGVDTVGTVLNGGTPTSGFDGLELLKFSNNNYSFDVWADNVNDVGFIGWYDNISDNPSTNTIPPGTGFFLFNPYTSNCTVTIAGSVLQGTNTTTMRPGFTLAGVQVPQAITLDRTATNNFPAIEGMEYLVFTNTGHGGGYAVGDTYADNVNDVGFIGWYDNITNNQVFPTPAVGQGFFMFNPTLTPTNWTRFFQVQ